MDPATILLLAVVLGIDAFAVAMGVGAALGRVSPRQMFRLSFHFGLFQFMMPVLGWLAGAQLVAVIGRVDHWIAFGLLAVIGGRMLRESFRAEGEEIASDVTRGLALVSLSIATSIDALAVGLSLAFLKVGVLLPSVVIGIVAAAMTATGMRLGQRGSARIGRHMERIGGVVLILIGIRIVIEHLG